MEDIERRAEEVLASVPSYVWDGRAVPVPVEEIADTCFGLRVTDHDDLAAAPGAPSLADGQTLSGLLLAATKEIWVNRSEGTQWPGRRRFTIGHELGHWVLHQEGTGSVFCRHAAIEEADPKERAPLPAPEEEANAFAAALLMPAALVREHYHALDGEKFPRLCRPFGTSGAAMGRRLHAVKP